jgi:hypothetical protein
MLSARQNVSLLLMTVRRIDDSLLEKLKSYRENTIGISMRCPKKRLTKPSTGGSYL